MCVPYPFFLCISIDVRYGRGFLLVRMFLSKMLSHFPVKSSKLSDGLQEVVYHYLS